MNYSKDEIAKNIEELRNSKGLKQEEFANKLNVSRPTVSNWEQAKSLPTTDQLIQIAQTFCVSIDELLGLKKSKKIMLIVDSSILCRRPRILEEMNGKKAINYICITETVLDEMNYQKDRGKRKQQAWLAMKSFVDLQKKDEKRFLVLEDVVNKNENFNDNKIINAALREAKKDSSLTVFLLAEDVYFPLKAASTLNFKVLNLEDYEREFSLSDEDFSPRDTGNFYNAVKNGNILDAEKVKKGNPDINHTDPKTGYTPCIQAIRNRDKKMLEYLISLPGTDINKCDDAKYRLPPISHAVQIKNLEFIKILLQNGADIDKGSQGDNYGNTALMIAAWHGELEIVKYLVEQGACCNQQDSNGFTPLIKACIRKCSDVANYLVDKTDLNIHSRYENKTAKDYALQINDPEINKKFAKTENNEV